MNKQFAFPALITLMFLFSSCCEDTLTHVILDDDTVCGDNVLMGYQAVSDQAKSVLPVITEHTRFVYVNAAGEEMTLTQERATEQKSHLNYKLLCSNYEWNTSQYAYYEGQILEYVFSSDSNQSIRIMYSFWVDVVPDESGHVFDRFTASLYTSDLHLSGGVIKLIADNRGQQLPADITKPGEWDRMVGDTTMLGHSFQDVTYTNWGVNEGKGIFFQKGLGIVGIYSENKVIWVLDRVE